MEQQLFQERQRILDEMERLNAQESEVKREALMNSRTARLQAEAAR